MTTHKIDTVALAPEAPDIQLYVVKSTGITPAHKLEALFRMSHNIRDLMNYYFKVYTESPDDARFYEGIYQRLLTYCNQKRETYSIEEKKKNRNQFFIEANQKHERFLSRRHQMSFYSANIPKLPKDEKKLSKETSLEEKKKECEKQ